MDIKVTVYLDSWVILKIPHRDQISIIDDFTAYVDPQSHPYKILLAFIFFSLASLGRNSIQHILIPWNITYSMFQLIRRRQVGSTHASATIILKTKAWLTLSTRQKIIVQLLWWKLKYSEINDNIEVSSKSYRYALYSSPPFGISIGTGLTRRTI